MPQLKLRTVVSYQIESFSSKWVLPCLPPSSLELWWRERASRQISFWWRTLILIGHYGILPGPVFLTNFIKTKVDTNLASYLPVTDVENPALHSGCFAGSDYHSSSCVVDEDGRIPPVNFVVVFRDSPGIHTMRRQKTTTDNTT